jgi:hypothetical protein
MELFKMKVTGPLFLPCHVCSHECALDARVCPSCGTRKHFGLPSRLKSFFLSPLLFLFGILFLFVADEINAEISFAKVSGIWEFAKYIASMFGYGALYLFGYVAKIAAFLYFLILLFRPLLLQFLAVLRQNYPSRFLYVWEKIYMLESKLYSKLV